MSDDDIGKFYDRMRVEREVIVKAFARVRGLAGKNPSGYALLKAMREVEDNAGNTGD